MATKAITPWQRGPEATFETAAEPRQLAWPLACLLLGGISAVLWSMIWAAILALFG